MRETLAKTRRESWAEINVGNRVVEHEITHRSGNFHLSVEHDVGAVHNVESLFDVVIADENSNAAMPQARDDCLNIVNGYRIDARERLIEHHELWTGN